MTKSIEYAAIKAKLDAKPSERRTVPIAPQADAATNRRREKLMPAVDAVAKALGYRPHVSTIHRWHRRGVKFNGQIIHLEAFLIGGRLLCSIEAVDRFADATNDAGARQMPPPKPARSESKRDTALAKANASLAKSGI